MSKAAKQGIFILIFLLVCSLGFAGFTVFEKQKLQKAKIDLEVELQDTQGRVKKYAKESKSLKGRVQQLDSEKLKISDEKIKLSKDLSKLKRDLRQSKRKAEGLSDEVSSVKRDRDKWKRRIDNVSEERDDLMDRVKKLKEAKRSFDRKIAKFKSKVRELESKPKQVLAPVPVQVKSISQPVIQEAPLYSRSELKSSENEEYWASVLEAKASLEVELNQLEGELSNKVLELVELKQSNENFVVELDDLKYEKEKFERDVKYEIEHKTQMINNLSLELARSRNNKKFISERASKLSEENVTLRKNVKRLVSAKGALEKSIVQITRDKTKIEKELGKTETLIQSKIDEIWEIKDSLDQTIKQSVGIGKIGSASNGVELPPIIVGSSGISTKSLNFAQPESNYNGRIVSINESNNFVIVDIGERAGLRLGDALSVYRGSEYVGRLEVIQLRKDIAAADLKDQWNKIRVGDVVK